MNKKKYRSMGINALLNALKSGLSILFPLITYPYAFRVLHAEGIGKVDYANSIVGYFILLAGLGIATYAVREGAKVREDKEKVQQFACQIFTINIYSTIFAYLALAFFVFVSAKLRNYQLLIAILGLSIFFSTLGIEWVNTIYEDYLYITIRSIVTHLLSMGLLFILVRTEKDFYYYALLTVVTNGVICVWNWLYCRKYLHIHWVRELDLKRHAKPIMVLFANSIATSIYVSADTTMLGWMEGDYFVGLYSIAVKIYSVCKRMMVALYSVTISRISYYVGQNDKEKLRETYSELLCNLFIVLIPASMGLVMVSKEIIMLMGGEEYLNSVYTLQILAISMVGAILGGAVTYCLNIPLGREKYNMIATILSAIINISLNLILIPIYKQNGAAITTLISEFFVFIFCVLTNKEFFSYVDKMMLIKNGLHALVGSLSIVGIAFIVHIFVKEYAFSLMLITVLSGLCYLIELRLLGNQTILLIIKGIKKKRR